MATYKEEMMILEMEKLRQDLKGADKSDWQIDEKKLDKLHDKIMFAIETHAAMAELEEETKITALKKRKEVNFKVTSR